ncbi:proton-translocating transhydrogenase family protein, partial [Lactiplantibacillus plantarum]
MSQELYTNLAIFVLSLLVGFEVISKIPATLHTPMMSGANAIHGVVVVGSILVALEADSPLFYVIAF